MCVNINFIIIQEVETGTRAEDRTTVPFLYSIQGVDNFDVIDFPGVDDQDDRISDLVNLLRTLSQLVVFVVNYKYIKHAMYCTIKVGVAVCRLCCWVYVVV